MPLRIKCPKGHPLTVPSRSAGKWVQCPSCGARTQIPSAERVQAAKQRAAQLARIEEAEGPADSIDDQPPIPRPPVKVSSAEDNVAPLKSSAPLPRQATSAKTKSSDTESPLEPPRKNKEKPRGEKSEQRADKAPKREAAKEEDTVPSTEYEAPSAEQEGITWTSAAPSDSSNAKSDAETSPSVPRTQYYIAPEPPAPPRVASEQPVPPPAPPTVKVLASPPAVEPPPLPNAPPIAFNSPPPPSTASTQPSVPSTPSPVPSTTYSVPSTQPSAPAPPPLPAPPPVPSSESRVPGSAPAPPLPDELEAADAKEPELPGEEHPIERLLPAYYVAGALGLLAVFSMAPGVVEIVDFWRARAQLEVTVDVGFWAWLVIFLGVVQLAYAGLLAHVPDYSSVWVVSLLSLAMASFYAGALAVVMLAGPQNDFVIWLQLEYVQQQHHLLAAQWCLCIVSLSGMLAWFSGALSWSWQRAATVK